MTFNHDFRKSIYILLSVIPKEDIYGLRKISVVLRNHNKKFPSARGLYDGFNDPNNRVIFLFTHNIFPKNRVLFTIFPIIMRAFIGYVLLHELGHHYHHMHHGIKKEEREIFANNYRRKYFRKWLHTSKLFKMMSIFEINRHFSNHSGKCL